MVGQLGWPGAIMLDETISRLIASIYAAADDRAAWNAAMDAIIQRLDADWMLVAVFDERQRAPFEPEFHRPRNSRFNDALSEYRAETYRDDPTNRFAAANPAGGLFDSRMALASGTEKEREYLRWNRSAFGSRFWRIHYNGRGGLNLGASLHTTDDQGPLTGERARLFAMLYGHIDAAARLAARPPRLDGPEPTLILDGLGEIVAASEAARILLSQGDGIVVRDSRPRATSRRSAAPFDRAIRSALDARRTGTAGGSASLERASGPPLLAITTPLMIGDVAVPALRPQALVRLVDPAGGRQDPVADWSTLFGFTPAESRLARALMAGEGNLRHTAGQLGIAYATARVQLAALFDKANVRSQVQLVRLLTKLGCWAMCLFAGIAQLAEGPA